MVIVAATVAALVVAGLWKAVLADSDEAHTALAVLAACVGAAAVALGQTAGKLSGNRRAEWVIPALALYSAVIVPSTALLPSSPAGDVSSADVGNVVTFAVIVGLLLAAIRPPERFGARVSWAVAAGTAVLAVGLDDVMDARSAGAMHLEFPLPVGTAILILWCSVSTAVVVAGYRTRSAPLWRVGLGFSVIAIAHLYRAVWPQALAENGLVFVTLRLLGTIVVLFGVAQLLRRALNRVTSERFSHQEDMRLAGLRATELTRDAEQRDHELRNCLTALSGLTTMLDDLDIDEPRAEARSAALSELDRMSGLLAHEPPDAPVEVYDAARIVRELVALWRVAGLRIEATVPTELAIVGRVSTLAQVLTNLLANCARHAPGSPVAVVARRVEEAVHVQVSDTGPRGPATSAPPGKGIGLALSRKLLEAEGGWLHLPPGDRRGFTVVIELATFPLQWRPTDVTTSSAVAR